MPQRPVWSEAAALTSVLSTAPLPMRLFDALQRYLVSGEGDVKQLQGRDNEFRLRIGEYPICFTPQGDSLQIHWVRHRREAYR